MQVVPVEPGREIGWNGVYRLSPDGHVSVVIKDLRAPNGIGSIDVGRAIPKPASAAGLHPAASGSKHSRVC